jgi:hypothetical protein
MFGSEILEVAIGLTLLYLLLSAMASALREALEAWFNTRGEHLERGVRELLQDPDGSWLARGIYEHPLVAGLFKGGYGPRTPGPSVKNALFWLFGRSNLPAYIPASSFAAALMDLVARGPVLPEAAGSEGPPPPLTIAQLRANVEAMGNPFLQRALLIALDRSRSGLDGVQANLEAWFNSAMDRVSGWYKRRTQWVLLVLGVVLAVSLNVNTITVADFLLRDGTAREAIVAQATAISRDTTVLSASYDSLNARLQRLNLPIGWAAEDSVPRPSLPDGSATWRAWPDFWLPVLGWLLTALAVSLGAPFWFDVLNKFIVIRSTVKPHEKSPEEASEDRQRAGSQQSSQRIGGARPGDGTGAGGGGTAGDGADDDGGGGGGDGDGGAGAAASAPPAAVAVGEDDTYEPRRWNGDNPDEGVL